MTAADFAVRPAGAYQKTIQVGAAEADALGRMTPGALAMYIGDATTEHMAALGLDARTLQENGLVWVLARTALEAFRLPRAEERVTLRTWAGPEKHWMYPHRTVMFSPAGEKLVGACSQWMLIGADTRKLAPPSALMGRVPAVSLSEEPKAPRQSVPFPAQLAGRAERIVQEREIDFNGHMNNSHYLTWASELMDAGYLQDHDLRFFWVEYGREMFEEQRAQLHYAQEGDTFFVRGYIDGDESFSLKMAYGPHIYAGGTEHGK